MVEGFEDVASSFVADDEAAETGEPGEGSLNGVITNLIIRDTHPSLG